MLDTDPRSTPAPATSGPRVFLSRAAEQEIRSLLRTPELPEQGGLRISAHLQAGCSGGYGYSMVLEPEPEPDDRVLESGDLRIFLDPESAWLLDGLHVDFLTDSPMGEGFAFRNPNTAPRSSCTLRPRDRAASDAAG